MADELLNAVETGNVEEIQMLLAKGADVNAKNGDGATPLHRALIQSSNDRVLYFDVIKLLLDSGADVNHKDNRGRDALDWALMTENEEAESLITRQMGLRKLS